MLFIIFSQILFASELQLKFEKLVEYQNNKIEICDINPDLESKQNSSTFVFEGAGGFSPTKYLLKKLKINLELYSKTEIENNCLQFFDLKTCTKYIDYLNPKSKENIAHAIMLNAIDENQISESWYYFSQKHLTEALTCAEKLNKIQKREFKVVGYSMGAVTTINFAQKAKNILTIPVSLTIDPVPHGVNSLPNVVGNGRDANLKRPENVETWINFYQKVDKRSMQLGIRGNSVQNADKNSDVSHLFQDQDKERGHVKIVELPFILENISTYLY